MLAAHEQAGGFLSAPAFDALDNSLIAGQSVSFIGCVIGPYRVLSNLDAGVMSEVFLALDTSLNRRVALKTLPVEFASDGDRLRRFKQEARAASRKFISPFSIASRDPAAIVRRARSR